MANPPKENATERHERVKRQIAGAYAKGIAIEYAKQLAQSLNKTPELPPLLPEDLQNGLLKQRENLQLLAEREKRNMQLWQELAEKFSKSEWLEQAKGLFEVMQMQAKSLEKAKQIADATLFQVFPEASQAAEALKRFEEETNQTSIGLEKALEALKQRAEEEERKAAEEAAKKAEHKRATKEGVKRRRERLTETPEELYSKILQNKIANALPLCSSRHAIKTVTGGSVIKLLLPSGELTLELPRGRVWDVHTSKTIDLLLLKLTDQLPHFNSWDLTDRQRGEIARKRVVSLTLDEYMKACGLSDVKSARDRLNKSLDTLFEAKITTSENVPKRGKVELEMRIATARAKEESRENPIKGGRVAFAFSQEMAEHLSRHGIMPYPRKLLLINTQKYRHAYHIGRYLAWIQALSAGKEPPYYVSVGCIMDFCPDLPTYDEIHKGDRHIDRKIIEPFDKNLFVLKEWGHLEYIGYCKKYGENLIQSEEEMTDDDLQLLTNEEIENLQLMDKLEDYRGLYVKFKFPGKYYEALKSTTPPKKRRGRPPKAKAANSPDQPVGKEA